MEEATIIPFSSRTDLQAHFAQCLAISKVSLQLFDPDFTVFPLGSSETDAALRHFLKGSGSLQLVAHDTGHIERECPRFLRLLRDYSHKVECRVTPRNLRHLTDSFCIGDGVHIVRRFHSDHMRGEAGWHAPGATEISTERFRAMWVEAMVALPPSTTGL